MPDLEKMRFKFLLILILFQTQLSFGQSLKEVFLELPLGGLSLAEKKQMIYDFQNYKEGTEKQRPYLIEFQPENQFLSYSGSYEGSETLKCWSLSDGKQLIGIGYLECEGPCNHDLTFYLKNKEKTSKVSVSAVMPEVTIADFFDTERMRRDGITKPIGPGDFSWFYGFLYHLPERGETITVESQTHRYGKIPEKYKKYDLGSEIELVWNDGTFKKQKKPSINDAESQKHPKKFTIDNCVAEFSKDKVIETKTGYQFWFVDQDFLDGRTIKMSVVAPNSEAHPPQSHVEDEFFYVLEGTAEFYLDGQTKKAGANTSFYCPPNVEHGIKNAGVTELKYLVIKKYEK